MTRKGTNFNQRQNFAAFNRTEFRLNDFNHFFRKIYISTASQFRRTALQPRLAGTNPGRGPPVTCRLPKDRLIKGLPFQYLIMDRKLLFTFVYILIFPALLFILAGDAAGRRDGFSPSGSWSSAIPPSSTCTVKTRPFLKNGIRNPAPVTRQAGTGTSFTVS